MAQRSLAKRIWYDFLRILCRGMSVVMFRMRTAGRKFIPETGPVLVLANHQSHLDPVLVGLCCDRRMNYLARQTLFKFAPLRWLIESLDAIPIDREGIGLAGLKETLKRLKHDELVLLFPEGTRSRDGEVGALMPGFCSLARRGKAPLLPVGIDGAFDAWPRTSPVPRPRPIAVVFGPAIAPEEFATWDDATLLAEVERRIRACHAAARELRAPS